MANSLRASALFFGDTSHPDICLHPTKRQMATTTEPDYQQEPDSFSEENNKKSFLPQQVTSYGFL